MRRTAFLELGRAVIEAEARALLALSPRLDETFGQACVLLLECRGRTVVTGMGKSGHIARKVSATLASTGTPSFYVHPGEASHGDLGMITSDDAVVALSNSGETSEILTILPLIKRLGVPLITLTGRPESTLAREASVNLDVGVSEEACPLDLAPTSSTTAALAMGDALAVALLDARGFDAEDFARSHPGGRLGRRLLVRASDIMHTGGALPRVHIDAMLSEALLKMTAGGLGMTAVTSSDGRVQGVFTDGDLRRALDRELALGRTRIREIMTPRGITVRGDTLAAECLNLMERNKISGLLVIDDNDLLIGAFNFQDLLRAGVI